MISPWVEKKGKSHYIDLRVQWRFKFATAWEFPLCRILLSIACRKGCELAGDLHLIFDFRSENHISNELVLGTNVVWRRCLASVQLKQILAKYLELAPFDLRMSGIDECFVAFSDRGEIA